MSTMAWFAVRITGEGKALKRMAGGSLSGFAGIVSAHTPWSYSVIFLASACMVAGIPMLTSNHAAMMPALYRFIVIPLDLRV
jgi:hypothetical protein